MIINMNKKTNSINNLKITNANNPSSNNNENSNNNNNNNLKQSYYKNQTFNKDTTRENFYKEIRDSESNYANKDNENLLRKSTDFYFLPKIKHQNNNENSLSILNNNNNSKRNNLFKNKTIIIKNSNLNFGYMKNEITSNNDNNDNLVDNNNNNNNNFNTNMTNTINTTDSHSNTFFYNPKLRNSTSFKNYNFIDESYYYRFKTSPRKNMITTNFNNTSNNNMKSNNNNKNNSVSVSQKKLDFKSIIENEKFEEEKRLQQFFQKLNMSSINNFPSSNKININNNNNLNLIASKANLNHNLTVYKNKSNTEFNEKENKTLNDNDISNIKFQKENKKENNVKSNSEEKTNFQEKLKLNNQTTKNSRFNSLLYKKENNRRNTQSSNNLNYKILNQLNNYMTFAPKNNFDAIRPLMTKPTETVLNSVDTIKNRNKLKIINKKLQISKEIPMQSYMITNIKPPCLFDFNNKLKGKVVLKKETELQKMRNLKSNPEAYYEDEEIEFNNENESEKDNEGKQPLFQKIAENSNQKIKSELRQEQNNSSFKNQNEIKNKNNNENDKNFSAYNSNNYDFNEDDNGNKEKGSILNYLEKKGKKSATSYVNFAQQQLASVDNSFTLRNSERNYILKQNLNDISENTCSSDLDSSFKNANHKKIKAEFQKNFECREKLGLRGSEQNINFKNESDYFNDKEEKSNATFDSPPKVPTDKNNLGGFPARELSEKTDSDYESIEESVGSIQENKFHDLDDSGILQVNRHESLYIKAHRKLSKGNKNLKHLASMLSLKPSPERQRAIEKFEVPIIQLNPVSIDEAGNSNPYGLNFNNNGNGINSNNNKNYDSNLISNTNNTNHNYFTDNKNISNPNFNFNLNSNVQTNTFGDSPSKSQQAYNSPSVSNNMLNFNKSYVMNSLTNYFNNNKNNNNEEEVPDLAEHDFEQHEVEPNLKTKTEINKIKNKINTLKKKRFDFKNEFLNDVHKRLQKKAFEINPDYQSTKDIFLKYRQEKILEKTDFNISSRLHLQNRNPIFQINNMISFPLMIDDPVFLANIYNVNMFKIEAVAKNKIN